MKSTLLIGDCREKLKELPDESIDCVVTSPPYWGLRDYKTEPLIWDGAFDCEHEWGDEIVAEQLSTPKDWHEETQFSSKSSFCQKCGAWRGQLGLEPDPNLYIKHLTDIFDQVKRVLKPSGTCWVNLGDSYSGSGGDHKEGGKNDAGFQSNKLYGCRANNPDGIPQKCLVQIPSRFALEMTTRGWILRNEIIWQKPNCMPSSVTDRFTVDFEKVFFFVKSKRYYFKQMYDEPVTDYTKSSRPGKTNKGYRDDDSWKTDANRNLRYGSDITWNNPNGRNKRTVWTISTKPYSGSHFAVFPIDLIAPMIEAGCPPDGTVMDIFSGSGTVLEYARKNGLNGIGIELNPDYKELAVDRAILNIPPLSSYAEAAEDRST